MRGVSSGTYCAPQARQAPQGAASSASQPGKNWVLAAILAGFLENPGATGPRPRRRKRERDTAPSGNPTNNAATRAAAISSLHSRLASAQPRHNARYLSREANLRELRRAQPRHNRAARWPVQQPRRARSCHCVPHMHHAVTSLGGFASCVRGVAITPQQRSGSSRWNTRAAANRSTAARGPAGGCSVEVLAAILYGETATPAK
jgi:hypothetical protein